MSLGFTKPPLHDPDAIFKYGKAIGIEQERERIINILKSTNRLTTVEGGTLFNYADEVIALINGENE